MTRMIKLLAAMTTMVCMSSTAYAGSLNGTKWQISDGVTGEAKAIVKMKVGSDGVVSGEIIRIESALDADKVCNKCPGVLKGKPYLGLKIVNGLKAVGENEWDEGHIVDPETGKVYATQAKLSSDGQELTIREYYYIPLFGTNQTWKRVK